MSAWSPDGQSYDDFTFTLGSIGGGVVATDMDPNTAPPTPGRVFFIPGSSAKKFKQFVAGIVMHGGTGTAVLWAYSKQAGRWYACFSTATTAPDAFFWSGVGLNSTGVPDSMPLFLQLSANSGATTFVGILFH